MVINPVVEWVMGVLSHTDIFGHINGREKCGRIKSWQEQGWMCSLFGECTCAMR